MRLFVIKALNFDPFRAPLKENNYKVIFPENIANFDPNFCVG